MNILGEKKMNKEFKPDYEKAKLAVQEKKEANAHLKQDFLDLPTLLVLLHLKLLLED